LEGEVLGQGILKLNVNKVEPGQIPISCVAERAKNVKYDPLADTWEDVRWVIFTLNKYCYEITAKYPKFKTAKLPYQVETLKEFWVKKEGRWNQYVVYSGRLLKISEGKNSYPVNIFEIFRLYMAPEGAGGISEVSLITEDQIIINKRASQQDFHTSMLVDPPLEFYGKGLAPGEEKKLPLKAGEIYTSTQPNINALRPIVYQPVNPTLFSSAIAGSLQHAQLTLGIQNSVLGQNEQGTYTGTHFQKEKDSVMTRVKMKSFFLKVALKSLGYKALLLAKEYLKGGGFFEIWDEYDLQFVKLTYEDFENAEVDNVVVETIDAASLDPLTRIEKLVQIKQYSPAFPDEYLYTCIESIQPGFFDKKFIKALEDKIAFDEKLRKVQMESQLKELMLKNATMDMQLQQLQAQQAQAQQQQAMAQQMPAQPEMPPELPPEAQNVAPSVEDAPIPSPPPQEPTGEAIAQPAQGAINWEELVQSSAQTISQLKGISPEEAQAIVVGILDEINQTMPEATDEEKMVEYVSKLRGQ
jgi:hypothetical protein